MFVVDDDAFAVLNDVLSALRFLFSSSSPLAKNFKSAFSLQKEFRWKIFLGEDLQPLVVAVLCHLHGKLLVIHQSGKHCFTDDEYSQETKNAS